MNPDDSFHGRPSAETNARLAAPPRRRRWFWLRGLLLGTLALITLIGLFYAIEDWRGLRAWNRYRQALEQKGDSLAMKDFLPPMVPDAENFAMVPLLRPLFEYEPSAPDRQGQDRWRDMPGYKAAMAMFSLAPLRSSVRPPEQAEWTEGRRIDLSKWQTYVREIREKPAGPTSASSAGIDPQVAKRYGLNIDPQLAKRYGLTVGKGGATNSLAESQPTPFFPIADTAGKPADDVLLALTKYDAAFAAIAEAARRPQSRFAVHYDENWGALLPHLAVLKKTALALQLRGCASLARGDASAAFQDLMVCLRVADSLRTEPFAISQLVRQSLLRIGLGVLWEGMLDHAWTAGQLEQVAQQIGGLDLVADHRLPLRMSRAAWATVIGGIATSGPERRKFLESIWDLTDPSGQNSVDRDQLTWYLRGAPSGWLWLSLVEICREADHYLALEPRELTGLKAWPPPALGLDSLTLLLHRWHMGLRPKELLSQGLAGAVRTQTQLALAHTACALERYRLERGDYPETLEALVPGWLTRLPLDLMTTKPLIYRREGAGRFVLYSVGTDGEDDRGAFSKEQAGNETGDWVWRWPIAGTSNAG